MNIYCSTFDSNYLARAIVLYDSIINKNQNALFAFCCIDDESACLLQALALPRSIVVPIQIYAPKELLALKSIRPYGEFCWTLKPVAQRYLLDIFPYSEWVIYVDADMMCFGNPDFCLPSINYHYSITPHRFHKDHAMFEDAVGKYNAGYVAARNSLNGKAIIDYWMEKCIESCSANPSENIYGDQKYLNQFSNQVDGIYICDARGVNAAPWNIMNYQLIIYKNKVQIDGDQLLLYHFQGFRVFENGIASLYTGKWIIPNNIIINIYTPYIEALMLAYKKIKTVDPKFSGGVYPRMQGRFGAISKLLSLIRRVPNAINFPLKINAYV